MTTTNDYDDKDDGEIERKCCNLTAFIGKDKISRKLQRSFTAL